MPVSPFEIFGALALITTVVGNWIVGNGKAYGWLLYTFGAALWVVYGVELETITGTFASSLTILVGIRNYFKFNTILVTDDPEG